MGLECGVDTTSLSGLCALVARASGRAAHASKPISGSAVFRHESGIHCHALLANPIAYQPFREEEVGRTPVPFAVGKHSGAAGVRAVLTARGVRLPAVLPPEMMAAIRNRARGQKGSVAAGDLAAIAQRFSISY